jgi:hypothetical protein
MQPRTLYFHNDYAGLELLTRTRECGARSHEIVAQPTALPLVRSAIAVPRSSIQPMVKPYISSNSPHYSWHLPAPPPQLAVALRIKAPNVSAVNWWLS